MAIYSKNDLFQGSFMSCAFYAPEFKLSAPNVREIIVEKKNGIVLCKHFELETEIHKSFFLIIHPKFFRSAVGVGIRAVLKNALLHKYHVHRVNDGSNLLGVVWTNDTASFNNLFNSRVGESVLWTSQQAAILNNHKTLEFFRWMVLQPMRLQKNLSWRKVAHLYMEYASTVSYPLNTLLLKFLEAMEGNKSLIKFSQ